MSLPRRSQLLQQALDEAGVPGRIRELPDSTRTAAEAAAAVGCEVGAIASSLVFLAADEPLLIMTSGRHRVDTRLVARGLGLDDLGHADADRVRRATGQSIGGVAPMGHPTTVRTLIDQALADYPELWAAGGTPRTVFPLTFDQLVALTGGTVARVAAD